MLPSHPLTFSQKDNGRGCMDPPPPPHNKREVFKNNCHNVLDLFNEGLFIYLFCPGINPKAVTFACSHFIDFYVQK